MFETSTFPSSRGGVAAPLIKRIRSEAAQTGWSLTSYVTCERPPRPRYQRWLRETFLMRVHPSSRGGEYSYSFPEPGFSLLRHQFLDQGHRARFRLRRMRRKEDAFRPVQGRAAFLILNVQLCALFNQPLQGVIRSSVRGAHDGSNTHGIHIIDTQAEFVTELHGLQQGLRPFVIGLIHGPVDSRSRHQGRGPSESGNLRIGAVLQEQSHDGQIAGPRRSEEWRLSREVDPLEGSRRSKHESSNRYALLRPGVRVRAALEQDLDQFEQGFPVNSVFE